MEQVLPGGRVPPHHLEAERSVLGAMLQSSEAVMLAQESLVPDDFYDPAHREIFDAMLTLAGSSKPVDLVTVDEADCGQVLQFILCSIPFPWPIYLLKPWLARY